MTDNFLEKTILKKIDEFINNVIDLSSAEAEYPLIKEQAIKKGIEIIPLILHFLDGNVAHVEAMFQQLIMQRLPDARIMASFGDFPEQLNNLVKEVVEIYFNNNEFRENKKILDDLDINLVNNPEENEEEITDSDDSSSKLKNSVKKAFPRKKVVFDFRIRGELVDAFIPELKLALVEKNKKNYAKLYYLCGTCGINLLEIPLKMCWNYRRLLQYVKKMKK